MDLAADPAVTQAPHPPGMGGIVAGRAFAVLAVVGAVLAFAGLRVGGYWTDELFSLYVADHHGGFGEVLRRALTDTHPPAYYLVLHAWGLVFGFSEPALRSLSALFCTGAVALFAFRTGPALTPEGRAFAAAAATSSVFWVFQSQNVRDYGLAMLGVSALMILALRMRLADRSGRSPPALLHLGLLVAGLAASLTHFYAFLATGAVYAFLLLTIRRPLARLAFIVGGLAILALELAYIRGLIAGTHEDFHQLWFSNDPLFLGNQLLHVFSSTVGPGAAVAAAILAVSAWRRRQTPAQAEAPSEARWLTGLCAFGVLTQILGGLVVSAVFAPSFSDANVLTGSPFLWALIARLYDLGAPRPGELRATRAAATLIGLLAIQLVLISPIRFLAHTEQWRESAMAVAALPGCAGEEVPAVMPARFAPPTPFYLELFRRSFFGRYLPGGSDRIRVYPEAAFAGRIPDGALGALLARRARGSDACPLLAWAAHDMKPPGASALARTIAGRVGVAPGRVQIRTFYDHKALWLGVARRPSAFLLVVRPEGVGELDERGGPVPVR